MQNRNPISIKKNILNHEKQIIPSPYQTSTGECTCASRLRITYCKKRDMSRIHTCGYTPTACSHRSNCRICSFVRHSLVEGGKTRKTSVALFHAPCFSTRYESAPYTGTLSTEAVIARNRRSVKVTEVHGEPIG